MDAMCPYIKFNTQVHCNVAHSTNSLNSALRRILFNAFNKAVFFNQIPSIDADKNKKCQMLHPSISGEVGRVTQVSQGGIPCASTQSQCYI